MTERKAISNQPAVILIKNVPAKRPAVNNVIALEAKLSAFRKDHLKWIERLDCVVIRPNVEDGVSETSAAGPANLGQKEDDFQREISFYKQAQQAMLDALPRLEKLGVSTKRPVDYYAEMAKTDAHMTKVRERLLNTQLGKQRSEAAKRLREERKFASKVQREVLQNRQSEKRRLDEAVKKHQKGMKDQLENILEDRKPPNVPGNKKQQQQKGKFPQKRQNKKRAYRDEKFGFGGQKKRKKFNTAESAAKMDGFSAAVNSKRSNFQGKKGKGSQNKNKKGAKGNRPGKMRRNIKKNRRK